MNYAFERAQALGLLLMSTIEGAVIICRATRDLAPMTTACDALAGTREPPHVKARARSRSR